MAIGGGTGATLYELRKQAKKRREWAERFYGEKNLHCYAVGWRWKNRKRPEWFKNVLFAKNKEDAERILKQNNLPLDMIILRRLD